MKVFDWNKAAQYIKDNNVKHAVAGLIEDMFWTSGTVLIDGKPVPKGEVYVFLASTWATPTLTADGIVVYCWLDEADTEWDANTYWPQSALDILNQEGS